MATPDPLRAYLNAQKPTDAAIKRLLNDMAADTVRELGSLVGRGEISATVRSAQLNLVQSRIRQIQKTGWDKMPAIINNGQETANVAAVNEFELVMANLARELPRASARILTRAAVTATRRSIDRAVARQSGSGYKELSNRVYKNANLLSGRIDRIVESAIGRGVSARTLAKEVRTFILPGTPGGVSYAAMRLGRTELNNSFHASQIDSAKGVPFVTGQQWNLSGSHPRADTCNDYADADSDNLGSGVFRPDNVPDKPHPQCLCFITPVTVDPAQFVSSFLSGKYDSWLDQLT